jgi:ATP-dependent DNA helicase RecG
LEQLGDEGVSSSRNQVLMKLLEDVAVPGERFAVCENRGSGIGAMVSALRQAGMTPPVFEDRVATFRVTFPNQTLLDEATVGWLNGVPGDISDSQRMGLAMMRHGHVLTNSQYRQLLGVDSRIATRELGDLVDRGLVLQKGTRRWATYELRPGAVTKRAERKDRREEIVKLLRGKELSAEEIAKALGVGGEATRRWLRMLRADHVVTTTTESPRSPRTKYRLVEGRRGRAHK